MPGRQHKKGFVSKRQQRWAFANKMEFARRWARRTKKQPGGFKRLPERSRRGRSKRR
jgi:hypothetical protein